ncbi:MAG: septum formation initiator family protein [Akkermansia sp.]
MFFKHRHSRYTLDEMSSRRDKRVQVVRQSLPIFATILLLFQFLLLSLLCFKPWDELRSLEQEHDFVQARLEKAKLNLKQSKQEYIWMAQDPEYFEMIARDKNNLAQPGEHIIRIVAPRLLR